MQHESPLRMGLQIAAREQVAKYLLPVARWQLVPNAKDRKTMVLRLAHARGITAKQDIDQMLYTTALTAAIGGGEGHLCRFARVPKRRRSETIVAVATGVCEGFAEVAQEPLAATADFFR